MEVAFEACSHVSDAAFRFGVLGISAQGSGRSSGDVALANHGGNKAVFVVCLRENTGRLAASPRPQRRTLLSDLMFGTQR